MIYRISPAAERDLGDIWRYSHRTWGAAQADRYTDGLLLRFEWLTQNRPLWRPRDDIQPGLFSCAEHSHVIFFRASREGLEIVRVLHGRMDVKRQSD